MVYLYYVILFLIKNKSLFLYVLITILNLLKNDTRSEKSYQSLRWDWYARFESPPDNIKIKKI